jgi:hypothetical protein
MSPGRPPTDGVTTRERFSSGWTGAVCVGLFGYIAIAMLLILADGSRWPLLDVFNLYSDSLASFVVCILASAAARGSSEPAARRTWWLLTAALTSYTVGNLLHATYWLFGVDPFPSIGDLFFSAFYPLVFAAILTVIRAAAVRLSEPLLKADPALKDIPVVMLSAKGQETDEIQGMQSGADEYMTKPFSPRRLRQRIEELVRGHDSPQR